MNPVTKLYGRCTLKIQAYNFNSKEKLNVKNINNDENDDDNNNNNNYY